MPSAASPVSPSRDAPPASFAPSSSPVPAAGTWPGCLAEAFPAGIPKVGHVEARLRVSVPFPYALARMRADLGARWPAGGAGEG